MRKIICLIAMAGAVWGQPQRPDQSPLTNGTIRGVVLDAATGAPVAEADVAARPGAGKAVQTTTDA
ncbi:MAG: hypothetical protein JWP63_6387, partial [Candidatus Solibacter sp.]|nr:hypothetical protein [Candidatus Solibacter sp.]